MTDHSDPTDAQPPITPPVWTITARKFDGRLHYTLPAYARQHAGDGWWFDAQLGGAIDHITRGRRFPITRRSEMIFWPERWYNVYVNFQEDGTLRNYYCNVSLPPHITGTTLTFVDMDLDVEIWPDGKFEVLDVDEFKEHTAAFGYPRDVRRAATLAVLDILLLWHKRQPPFDRAPLAPF